MSDVELPDCDRCHGKPAIDTSPFGHWPQWWQVKCTCGMETTRITTREGAIRVWTGDRPETPAAGAGDAPAGWRLVPEEPTPHQYEEAKILAECMLQACGKLDLVLIYKVFLQAAPSSDGGEIVAPAGPSSTEAGGG